MDYNKAVVIIVCSMMAFVAIVLSVGMLTGALR